MDIAFVGQLVDSMETAVLQLEQAVTSNNIDQANKLRTFIFDLHMQIGVAIGGRDV
ncbi:MAG: hypothetical protein KKF50_03050 [Nanoarchaeota archaeon]|nr:hypothetical protein [Nanoarchaeota archaeon]